MPRTKSFQLLRTDNGLVPRIKTEVKPVRQRGFTMGDTGRLFSDWAGSVEKFQDSLRSSMVTLNRRAADLAENDPMCKRFLNLMETNVLGPLGVQVIPTPHDERGRIDRTDARYLREHWSRWGRRATCTKSRTQTWREHDGVSFRNLLIYGNAFRRWVPDPGNPYALACHNIDPQRLDYAYCRPRLNGQNEIRNGVEITEWNEPVNYYFFKVEFGSMLATGHEVISADWIDHLYIPERADQVVGVTWFAPVGARKKMLDGYEMAAVVAARVAASKMGFFQRTGESSPEWVQGTDEMPPEDVAPGMFEILPDGYEFKDFDPSWPSMNDEAFVKSIKRSICAGLNFSYNTTAMDLESVSWSGLRSAELSDHDFCRLMQHKWGHASPSPAYERWIRFALDFGTAIKLPAAKIEKFLEHKLRGRAWQWVNPKQQQEANTLALQNGSMLLGRLIEEDLGMSLEEYNEELTLELETLGDRHPLHWLKNKPVEISPETLKDEV
jgi:lambda family phage portal protein